MSSDNELLIEETKKEETPKEETPKEETKKEETKKEETKKEETKKATPFVFFKKDNKIQISVDGYHSHDNGQLQFVLLSDNTDIDKDQLGKMFTKVTYKFWFSRCPFNKLNRYRSRSMIYNSEDQNNTINELQLREYFLVYHLVDWNLKDENGEKIKIKFDPNESLSDETLELIYTLPSILIDTVLVAYQKKSSIN